MITFALTITYRDYFYLLKLVCDSVLAENVAKVIEVNNNSAYENMDYKKELGSQKIKGFYLNDNYGLGSRFKRGQIDAYTNIEYEYNWLFDDNIPKRGTCKKLLLEYEYLGCNEKSILISFENQI